MFEGYVDLYMWKKYVVGATGAHEGGGRAPYLVPSLIVS